MSLPKPTWSGEHLLRAFLVGFLLLPLLLSSAFGGGLVLDLAFQGISLAVAWLMLYYPSGGAIPPFGTADAAIGWPRGRLAAGLKLYAVCFLPLLVLGMAESAVWGLFEGPTEQAVLTGLREADASAIPPVLFYSILLGPLFEEVLFRGYLLPWFAFRRTGQTGRAIVACALIFAILHEPQVWVSVFALGCLFGIVRVRTGSLQAAVLLHVLHNGLGLALFAFGA